jgi:hypothetical protein
VHHHLDQLVLFKVLLQIFEKEEETFFSIFISLKKNV